MLLLLLACAPPKFDTASADSDDSAPYSGPPEITGLSWTCEADTWTVHVEARGEPALAELGFTSPTLQVVGEFGHTFPATSPDEGGDRAGHHGEGWFEPLLSLEVVAPEDMLQGARTGYACEDRPQMSVSVVLEDAEGVQLDCWMEGVDTAFHAELLDEGYGVYALSDCSP
ncbi:MAG: hypothetical protein H6740_00670 [Alphaproteobacteria bacterium]|nr:hypothetical protein [Alphaproteobacteria bacterium]